MQSVNVTEMNLTSLLAGVLDKRGYLTLLVKDSANLTTFSLDC